MSGAPDLDAVRGEMRRRRASLSDRDRAGRSARICAALMSEPRYLRATTVGLYWPVRGEVDLTPLLDDLWDRERAPCLPVVAARGNRMRFHRIAAESPMRTDRFGIPGPSTPAPVRRAELDLILTPVVAFDACGHRLGMGAGYYDRFLAPLLHRQRPARPLVLGCAYGFQELDGLPAEPWDVPLDGVVTEDGTRWFGRDRTCATG